MSNNPWFRAGARGVGTSAFIVLDLLKADARAPKSDAQAHGRMDKSRSGSALHALSQAGLKPHGAATKTLAHYRHKVDANRRRRSKG
jgi:hypothetical protein